MSSSPQEFGLLIRTNTAAPFFLINFPFLEDLFLVGCYDQSDQSLMAFNLTNGRPWLFDSVRSAAMLVYQGFFSCFAMLEHA